MQASRCALAFAALTAGLQCNERVVHALQFSRPAFEQGAVWQLLTAQWVHLGWLHAAVNALGAALILLTFAPWLGLAVPMVAWLGGYAGVAAVLWWDGDCSYYVGASGALHGLFVGCALAMVCHGQGAHGVPRNPAVVVWGGLAGLVLVAKLVAQHAPVASPAAGWLGFVTYYPAHEAGAAGGVLAVLLGAAWQSLRAPQSPGAAGKE